ncbi:hypothetical protein [Micromonospora polyrhachis]|uniref:Uncharacterized protein n=1 Tax=Micromonospora polyrhachis TaxID=1282883 RepID=A0A7W7SXA3_9ACTN|nr:hypothetical protein [Micromonospora polyrhachis]MBB4962588.1 hypothetical protein [Micromonospora polyrhachis]
MLAQQRQVAMPDLAHRPKPVISPPERVGELVTVDSTGPASA